MMKNVGPGLQIPKTHYRMVNHPHHMFWIRAFKDETDTVGAAFNFNSHKPEYGRIADFLVNFVQGKMRDVYGLREVLVPEAKHLDGDYA